MVKISTFYKKDQKGSFAQTMGLGRLFQASLKQKLGAGDDGGVSMIAPAPDGIDIRFTGKDGLTADDVYAVLPEVFSDATLMDVQSSEDGGFKCFVGTDDPRL